MVPFNRGKKVYEAIVLNALPKGLRGRIEKGRDVESSERQKWGLE